MEDAETMRQELEAMTQDVVMLVKENVFDLQAVQRALALTRDEEDVLQRMQTIAETMYAAGERSQQDVIKAQAEITMLKQKHLELQAQETTLKAKLNSLLNRRADSPLVLAAAEPPGRPGGGTSALFALAEKARPEIQGAESQIRRSRAERDLMKKEFRPDFRLGPGIPRHGRRGRHGHVHRRIGPAGPAVEVPRRRARGGEDDRGRAGRWRSGPERRRDGRPPSTCRTPTSNS